MEHHTVEDRSVRFRSRAADGIARYPLLILLFLVLSSCSKEISYDLQAVHTGGAERSWYWPGVEIDPFEYFVEQEIDSLATGFLGPPLPLSARLVALLSTDHDLLLLRDRKLYRRIELPEEITLMPQLAADNTGRIYLSSTDADLFAIDTNGTIAWRSDAVTVPSESFALPLWPLQLGDMIVTGHTDGDVAALDREGNVVWQRRLGSGLTPTIAASGSGDIVLAQTANDYDRADTVTVLGQDGEERWQQSTGGRIAAGPLCDGDRVLVGVADRNEEGKYRPALEAYDATSGTLLWRAPLKVLPRALAAGSEGRVFVSGGGGSRGGGGVVAGFGADGSKEWEIALEQSIPSTILATADALFFTARQDRSIGIFSYTHAGTFLKYAPIDTPGGLSLPPTILPTGTLAFVSRERPLIVENTSGGILF